MKEGLIYKDLSYKIGGLLFKVHNNLGKYTSEKEYADYFENLLKERGVKYERERRINYSIDEKIVCRNICDFIIENKIVVETKAVRFLNKDCYYQVKRYLAGAKFKLGILVNFRDDYLKLKRIINNKLREENRDWYQ
jgi:GxxExxY protein